MARQLPPRSGPASLPTIEEHRRIGGRWLRDAMAAYPGLLPEDALSQAQQAGGPLRSRSIRRYRADLRYGLMEQMELDGRLQEFEHAWAKVDLALRSRQRSKNKPKSGHGEDGGGGNHSERKTAADKVVDATEQEVRALFVELKRHALAHENPNSILAALFVLVAGHSGLRPTELRGATLEGSRLTLVNAKKRPGLHEPTRTFELAGLHEHVITGLALMLAMIDHDLNKREFAKWQKTLAGQLRRACQRIGARVLCLYSFRHIAIASWSAAGLSPQEIASLCGHVSIRTAHTHYARAGVGHKRKAVARALATREPSAGVQGREVTAVTRDEPTAPRPAAKLCFEVEQMPVPAPKIPDRQALAPEVVRQHFARAVDTRDAAAIGQSLRQAEAARLLRQAQRDAGLAGEPEGQFPGERVRGRAPPASSE